MYGLSGVEAPTTTPNEGDTAAAVANGEGARLVDGALAVGVFTTRGVSNAVAVAIGGTE
jgi:hypothetical protein